MSTRRLSSPIAMGPQERNRPNAASATFSCTERCGSSDTSRLAGTSTSPARIASAGCRNLSTRPSARTSPASARRTPAMQSNSSSCPWPSSAATPSTSPRLTRKETSLQRMAVAQAFHFERRDLMRCLGTSGARDWRLGRRSGDVRAQHQIDDRLFAALGRRDADGDSVAQHGRAVAEHGDFGHAMRDEDHARATAAKIPHDLEHALGKIGRQRRGDLVQHQNVRVRRQRAGKIDQAQQSEIDIARHGREINALDAEIAHRRLDLVGRDAREAHVLRDRQVGNDRGILVDRHDAGSARFGGRSKGDLLPGEGHLALIRREHAGDDLDERALARAVCAHERMGFARAHFEVRRTQRSHRSEGLRDAANVKKRRSVVHGFPVRNNAGGSRRRRHNRLFSLRSRAFARDQLLRRVMRIGRHRARR